MNKNKIQQGICIPIGKLGYCACLSGFFGSNCQIASTPTTTIAPNPCANIVCQNVSNTE
jgi:hypothetical protein